MIPLPITGAAYVLDLSSLARGLFETLPPAQSEAGEPIAVVAAVALRLVRLLIDHRPAFICVCADAPTTPEEGETPEEARLARYAKAALWPGYKAGRSQPGPEYDAQIERLIEICQAHRIPVHRRALGEELDVAVLRSCRAWPKGPIPDGLVRRWLEMEAAEEAGGA